MKACFNLDLISTDQLLLFNEIKRVRGKRDYALIATLLATGLKGSEIINIQLS
ncbi:hypothetical protein [Methylotuvimicrobium sp. KM1]|uniref:hypothetical protein n=1 Tax=Methylotuvimicrobium sp. KM1 TaxID=3377707 RepID=UPI00384C6EFC